MVSERSGNEGSPSWIVLTDASAITLCLICHLCHLYWGLAVQPLILSWLTGSATAYMKL